MTVPADATRSGPPADEPRGGEACLVFVEGAQVLGLTVPLDREVVLGRDATCGVCLFADDVSRRHARIANDGGDHLLVDLASTNGTHVNGQAIDVHRLRSGDRIRLDVPVGCRSVEDWAGESAAGSWRGCYR